MTTVSVTDSASPAVISGLSAGNWTFTVEAVNAAGAGPSSLHSSPIEIPASRLIGRGWKAGSAGYGTTVAQWKSLTGVTRQAYNDYFDYESTFAEKAANIVGKRLEYQTPVNDGSVVNIFTIGLLPSPPDGSQAQNRPRLAQAAAGADLGSWTSIGNAFKSAQFDSVSTLIRLGHECNGNWYPWSTNCVAADMANFRAAWRVAVRAIRATCPSIRFELCLNAGYPSGGSDATGVINGHFAGDAYVDVVGFDWYNSTHAGADGDPAKPRTDPVNVAATAQLSAAVNQGSGDWFGSFEQFCGAHNKLFSMSEWGLSANNNASSVNDVPYTVDFIFDTLADMVSRRRVMVSHDCYFEVASNALSENPKSLAQYTSRWMIN